MKKVSPLILLAASAALMSCGGGTANCSVTSGEDTASSATLKYLFATEQKLGYANNRPQYNYYETTFTFQELELYDDNTYKLTESSCTFSALIIPEEGNAATGNARARSLLSYYGTYEAVVDELDDTGLNITFGAPTRYAGFRVGSQTQANGVIDTDAWDETMKSTWADVTYSYDESFNKTETGRTEYATGAEFLAAKKFTLGATFASTTSNSMDWVEVSSN
ncbi:MAG: hypothetical protein K6F32_00380 [Bacilli bacterium]|nr:hypothetical protein [Bacilli bacterium]